MGLAGAKGDKGQVVAPIVRVALTDCVIGLYKSEDIVFVKCITYKKTYNMSNRCLKAHKKRTSEFHYHKAIVYVVSQNKVRVVVN